MRPLDVPIHRLGPLCGSNNAISRPSFAGYAGFPLAGLIGYQLKLAGVAPGDIDRTLQIKLIVPAPAAPPTQLAEDQAIAEIHLDYALAKRLAEGILKQF
jgi:hypothetical protein